MSGVEGIGKVPQFFVCAHCDHVGRARRRFASDLCECGNCGSTSVEPTDMSERERLLHDAARASELFGDDACEEFAAALRGNSA